MGAWVIAQVTIGSRRYRAALLHRVEMLELSDILPKVVVGKEIEKVGRSIHFNIMNEANMGKTGTHSSHSRQRRASRAFHVTLGMTFQAGKADGSLIRLTHLLQLRPKQGVLSPDQHHSKYEASYPIHLTRDAVHTLTLVSMYQCLRKGDT